MNSAVPHPTGPASSENVVSQAEARFRAGDHRGADELLRPLAAADPAPLLNLASALLAMGDAKAALRAASDACHLAPAMAEVPPTVK